jgi:hypothetical protein
MCLASVIRPEKPAPEGQESLAQGLLWISRNKRSALKGQELRAIRFPGSDPILAQRVTPSGLIGCGELSRVTPGLCFPGHFGPTIKKE